MNMASVSFSVFTEMSVSFRSGGGGYRKKTKPKPITLGRFVGETKTGF